MEENNKESITLNKKKISKSKVIGLMGLAGVLTVGVLYASGVSGLKSSNINTKFPINGTLEEKCQAVAKLRTDLTKQVFKGHTAQEIRLEFNDYKVTDGSLTDEVLAYHNENIIDIIRNVDTLVNGFNRAKSAGNFDNINMAEIEGKLAVTEKKEMLECIRKFQ